jgi:hypothetical protein
VPRSRITDGRVRRRVPESPGAISGNNVDVPPPLPWPVRSLAAGIAGTATLSLAYRLEHRLRPRVAGPLDYDDGPVPGQIVCSILHLPDVSRREEDDVGLMLRWSYGSAFALAHGLLRRRIPEPQASLVFGGALMTMTFTVFPLLGHTPPPWRWRRSVLLTSVGTHVAYVAAVAYVDNRTRR